MGCSDQMFSHGAKRSWEEIQYPLSSVKVVGENSIYAATLGKGVYRREAGFDWSQLNEGLPDATSVNRLILQQDVLHACTDHGLYYLKGDSWCSSDIAIPCFQYRRQGGCNLAATQYGIWENSGAGWSRLAMPNSVVYDILLLPHYIIAAYDQGIALYDRYTDAWAEFPLDGAVTGLTVYGSRVLGITEQGELAVGNTRGGFEKYRFGSLFMFAVRTIGHDSFVCTDRGVYRICGFQGSIRLQSVQLGMPVTDVDFSGDRIHMATLFQGVQTVTNPVC